MSNATSVELAVKCHACGEPIESIPTWLIGASVRFECERCRQKHAKVSAELEAVPRRAPKRTVSVVPADELEEEEPEVIEDDISPEPDVDDEPEPDGLKAEIEEDLV